MGMGLQDGQQAGPQAPLAAVDLKNGLMSGRVVQEVRRTLSDLTGTFADPAALARLPGDRLAYRVQMWAPVAEGTEGGLVYGVTIIEPGDVGGECFMTKGHFHARREAAEFYWTYEGQGLLLMMDEGRHCRVEQMAPGSLHYIPGGMAHRTVNVGDAALSFGSCWPATAGHDYATIAHDGFSVRVYRDGGGVRVVDVG
jgi:glucose-6-phosphate isomerase, archaeal